MSGRTEGNPVDPSEQPLSGAPRHLRRQRFQASSRAGRPRSAGRRPDEAAPPRPHRRVSHSAKRRIAGALVLLTLLGVAALLAALVLFF
ncbi:hypothetical protein ACU18_15685 [Arthrobacter sp. ZBG10]|uniref:hypothetical protein n=1 Tax=Micrococcaceae TaxID=1268 RepID=UPI000682783E|nr:MULTISPECIES: hypothetical protein [Micrococcaceae]KNH15860.1 hypothetical protein ACU18_15685 [Arthrobacter sp. ZBG10]KQR03502.1 hypothetical protein ASF72_10220 [Arthrobacter sp. Leaf141]